jgi:hypothetical protein
MKGKFRSAPIPAAAPVDKSQGLRKGAGDD